MAGKNCKRSICNKFMPHAEHDEKVMPRIKKDTKSPRTSAHGEVEGSLGSMLTRKAWFEANMKRMEYEADLRAMERWARQGFVSVPEGNDELGPIPDDDVVE